MSVEKINNNYIVEYKGQTLKTKNFLEVTEEEQKQLKEQYYARPEIEEVYAQMRKLATGLVMNDKLTNYYFKDLMAKVMIQNAKWTVEDVFNSCELLGVFKAKVVNSPKTFSPDKEMFKNIDRAIQLGGKGYARKPTKFPVKTADYIVKKYNANGNWYDFSCGWGDRLTSALKNKINYFGTDPNYVLVDRLNEMYRDWKIAVPECTTNVEILSQGSETFIPEYENKMGLAFSSPPYFNLEDYKIGNQSYKEGIDYEEWKMNYLYPTLNNIQKYLINGGYLAINVKNVDKYNLCQDVYDYCIEIGLEFLGIEDLKNNQRIKSTGELGDSTEKIFIFQKGN